MNPFANIPPQPMNLYDVSVWVNQYIRPAMRTWMSEVVSLFQARGFTVQIVESTIDNVTTGLAMEGVRVIFRVSRSGATVELGVQQANGFERTPEQYVENFMNTRWSYELGMQTGTPNSGPVVEIQPTTQTPAAQSTAPAMTGQTVTVISPETMTAMEQGGSNPAVQENAASGTANPNLQEKIDTLPTNAYYNPHQWNYLFKEATGYDGPAPEAVGLNGDEAMSYAKWSAAVAGWYRTTYPEFTGLSSETTGASDNMAAATPSYVFTLIGALLSLLGLGK